MQPAGSNSSEAAQGSAVAASPVPTADLSSLRFPAEAAELVGAGPSSPLGKAVGSSARLRFISQSLPSLLLPPPLFHGSPSFPREARALRAAMTWANTAAAEPLTSDAVGVGNGVARTMEDKQWGECDSGRWARSLQRARKPGSESHGGAGRARCGTEVGQRARPVLRHRRGRFRHW